MCVCECVPTVKRRDDETEKVQYTFFVRTPESTIYMYCTCSINYTTCTSTFTCMCTCIEIHVYFLQ